MAGLIGCEFLAKYSLKIALIIPKKRSCNKS